MADFSKFGYSKLSKVKAGGDTDRKMVNKLLKQHHHVWLDREFKADCEVWLMFLTHKQIAQVVHRPMLDVDVRLNPAEVGFYSDVSRSEILGFGCIYQDRWIYGQWPQGFISQSDPSIEYLELLA